MNPEKAYITSKETQMEKLKKHRLIVKSVFGNVPAGRTQLMANPGRLWEMI